MRGRFFLAIWVRTGSDSGRYKDKWNYLDKLKFTTISTNVPYYTKFKVESIRRGFQSYVISRDELAFVRLIFMLYGPHSYCIRVWAKGKNRGIRIFFDGLISKDRKFIRKRNTGYFKNNPSIYEKSSFAINSECYINKYMRTKFPGKWYNF